MCQRSVCVHLYKGQSCTAGSRIFVQEGIYDQFLSKFTAIAAELGKKTGDPFKEGIEHGPQVSKLQFDVRPLSHLTFYFEPSFQQFLSARHGIY